jgi:hypothetical protein
VLLVVEPFQQTFADQPAQVVSHLPLGVRLESNEATSGRSGALVTPSTSSRNSRTGPRRNGVCGAGSPGVRDVPAIS